MMASTDEFLQPVLNFPAEVVRVKVIDAPVHEPEAVRRADNRINGQIEDGAAVNAHIRQTATMPLPGVGQVVFDRSEYDFQSSPPVRRLRTLSSQVPREGLPKRDLPCFAWL